jgi:predicted O-methyltransferase YrrM
MTASLAHIPDTVHRLEQATRGHGFAMASDRATGQLLRALVASKPSGRILELGTGTGLATAWMLAGMDEYASLITVDNDPALTKIAEQHLQDNRLTIITQDALELLTDLQGESFDFIFADTWPGKIEQPELALALVAVGGMYVIDDLNLAWTKRDDLHAPEDYILDAWHGQRRLLELLEQRTDFVCVSLEWSTGLMVCTRMAA